MQQVLAGKNVQKTKLIRGTNKSRDIKIRARKDYDKMFASFSKVLHCLPLNQAQRLNKSVTKSMTVSITIFQTVYFFSVDLF